jgi:nucleotide-binding universal stress UspA family protein
MKHFHRVVVALDQSDFDAHLMAYANRFTELTSAHKVYFVYVEKNLELPKHLRVTYKDEQGKELPRDEALRKILRRRVAQHFKASGGAAVEVDVLEGNPMEQLLHYVRVKDADLLVLGNKRVSEGSGVLARKVARNTECAVLFVPETSRTNLHHLLVPLDFSDYSKVAMAAALEIAHEVPEARITAFHVFDVPLQGYPTISLNYETFLKSMVAFKMEAFKEYMRAFDAGAVRVEEAYQENDPPGIAKHINRHAQEHHADLIVMGAQGHTFLERLLLGSVTEKLVTFDKTVPVLVLRK